MMRAPEAMSSSLKTCSVKQRVKRSGTTLHTDSLLSPRHRKSALKIVPHVEISLLYVGTIVMVLYDSFTCSTWAHRCVLVY